jgi:hypothetical protein
VGYIGSLIIITISELNLIISKKNYDCSLSPFDGARAWFTHAKIVLNRIWFCFSSLQQEQVCALFVPTSALHSSWLFVFACF